MNNLVINTSKIAETGPLRGAVERYASASIDDIARRQDLAVSYEITAIENALLLRGSIRGTLTMNCARCLDGFEFPVELSFVQTYPAGTETVDVGEEARQQLVLSMPAMPVCAESCKGLCPVCGKKIDGALCCRRDETQPDDIRWEQLRKLLKKR